jgi:hypothetical protein
VLAFEKGLYQHVETVNPGLLSTIMEKKVLDDGLKADMQGTLQSFKERFVAERQSAAVKA